MGALTVMEVLQRPFPRLVCDHRVVREWKFPIDAMAAPNQNVCSYEQERESRIRARLLRLLDEEVRREGSEVEQEYYHWARQVGWSPSAIARISGRNKSSVKRGLDRLREKLSEKLSDHPFVEAWRKLPVHRGIVERKHFKVNGKKHWV